MPAPGFLGPATRLACSLPGMGARLAIVGCGRMGSALIGGLLTSGWAAAHELLAVDADTGALERAAQRFPGLATAGSPGPAAGAVLAVKPQDAEAACRQLAAASVPRVLSVVAGVRTRSLEAWLGGGTRVVRAMPNTPALVGAGASALAAGSRSDEDDLAWAESVLGSVGLVVRVPEDQLDAVTALSGSGPAYVFLVVEALIEAGVRNGLSPQTARQLSYATLSGAARMLSESDAPASELRQAVTSPGGTTEAALRVLADRRFAQALIEAVGAAAARSRELGSA